MSLRHKLAIVAGLYVVEGLPAALFHDVWPVYLREVGVSRATIGALSALSAAWGLKVLWSPLVGRYGEPRHWIALASVAIALALLAVAWLDPRTATAAVACAIACVCLASATQDIAIDAYSIGLVRGGEEGPANATRVAAFRTALLVFGGGVLLLPRHIGWAATHQALACVVACLALFALRTPRLPRARAAEPSLFRSVVSRSFASWRERGGVAAVLAFVLLFRLPDLAMGPMVGPFWVDGGIPREHIALVKSGLGFVATLAGAALGGVLVRRLGIAPSLGVSGALAVVSNLGYAAAAYAEAGPAPIYLASVMESLCSGTAAVGFMSFLMRICEREYAAVQYATLTSLGFLAGSLARGFSGLAAEALGYAGFFAASAALGLPAFAFLRVASRWARQPRDETP